MRNVPNEPLGGEFVGRMVQTNDADMRGVPIKLLREESASRMAQRGSLAASRGVPINRRRGEFVSRMELRSRDAVM